MAGRNNLLKPYYDIQLVRSLAASGSAKFLMRADGKADPANVGMDTKMALGIIASLSPMDFDMTVEETADHRRTCTRSDIKFWRTA